MGLAFNINENNDWDLDGSGKLEQVDGTDKLKRDILKMFITEKTNDYPVYGQELDAQIGSKIKSLQSVLAEVKRKVYDTIQRFIDWQGTDLTVTTDERLEASEVYVYPSLEDPTRVTFNMQLYNGYRESLTSPDFEITP